MKAILIDPVTQTIAPYTVDHRLKTLQAAVGGLIAIATTLDTGDVLYVNDEGLLTDQPRFFTLAERISRFPAVPSCGAGVPRHRHGRGFDHRPDPRTRKLRRPCRPGRTAEVRTVTFDSADEFLDYLRRIQHRPIKTR